MEIKTVVEVLAAEGFAPPCIEALLPDVNNYSAMLMQPLGCIEADPTGVRNRDRALAEAQFGKFLDAARQTGAALAVTPEYATPWSALVRVLSEGKGPEAGKLWVLGCESIKYSQLQALKGELAELATVLFEPLQPDESRFVDPLAYVFRAKRGEDEKTAILVQFKTHPMGDKHHFEINSMQRGSRIYQFGGDGKHLRLVSLICSDVLDFDEAKATALYDRSLIIHIQLNPKPRQDLFRLYRDLLFLKFKEDQTELICLNWARNVILWDGGKAIEWKNNSASAWYLKSEDFDAGDATLCSNHKRGLYYTWLKKSYTNVLFFNYEPAVFNVIATKVAHIGVPAPASRRVGPKLVKTCFWDEGAGDWVEHAAVKDEFEGVVAEAGQARQQVEDLWKSNPFCVERVLALCAGEIEHSEDWHGVQYLDSCSIDGSEVIYRMTFCQDTDGSGGKFRKKRLKRCGNLWDILKHKSSLPEALKDFEGDFRLEWTAGSPHQNAVTDAGGRASVIYLGEESGEKEATEVASRIEEFLRRSLADREARRRSIQRVAVWYRDEGKIVTLNPNRHTRFDQGGDTPAYDIGREG